MSPEPPLVFETERLAIRKATIEHVAMFFDLWNDPRVMANVGFPHGLRMTREQIQLLIEQQSAAEFDRLLVIGLKMTDEAIGECKLGAPDAEGIAETDVKLLPRFWGHRYGVETKRGLVNYLFTHTNCDCVQATPNVGNIASIKMQEAVGCIRVDESTVHFPESMRAFTTPVHVYVYWVYRQNWETAITVNEKNL
jgi:RimJ/RimL family protein N-acetyltransferase